MVEGFVGTVGVEARADEDRVSNRECGRRREIAVPIQCS